MGEIVEKVRLEADTKEAEDAVKNLENSLTSAFIKGQIAAEVFTETAGAIKDIFKDAIEGAMKEEVAMANLTAALQLHGVAVDYSREALVKQAEALERYTGIAHDHIFEAQKLALNYGIQTENMDKAMKASAELAAVTGGDLQSAFTQLMRIHETGTVPRTLQAMEAFKGLSKEQLQNVDVMQLVIDKMGGQAEAKVDTLQGATTQLKLAWDGLLESFGKTALVGGVAKTAVQYLADEVRKLTSAFDTDAWKTYGLTAVGMLYAGPIGALLGAGTAAEGFGGEGGAAPEQMALVDPSNPQGLPPATTHPVKTKKEKGLEFDLGQAGEDMVMMADGRLISRQAMEEEGKAYRDAVAANNKADEAMSDAIDQQWDKDAKVAEAARKTSAEKQVKDKKEWDAIISGLDKDFHKQEADRAREALAERQKYLNLGISTLDTFAVAMIGGLEKMAEGEDVAWGKLIKSTAQGLGAQLIAQGLFLEIKGAADIVSSLWPPNPVGEAAGLAEVEQGGIELGAGALLFAGSVAIPGGGKGGASAGSKGGSSGGSSPSSGFTGGGGSSGPPSGNSGHTYNITVTGDVLDSVNLGVTVKRAIEAANRAGV